MKFWSLQSGQGGHEPCGQSEWEERVTDPHSVQPRATSDSVCKVGASTWCHFPGAGTWQPPSFHAGPWGPGFGHAGPLANSGRLCRAGWAGSSGCLASWDVNSALARGTSQQEALLDA